MTSLVVVVLLLLCYGCDAIFYFVSRSINIIFLKVSLIPFKQATHIPSMAAPAISLVILIAANKIVIRYRRTIAS